MSPSLKPLLNEKHVRQILAYADSAIGFFWTHFYLPYKFHEDTKLTENTYTHTHTHMTSLVTES
jgi:hypothetical protein